MSEAGLTPKSVAELSNGEVCEDTVSRAISGDCRTLTKLWAIFIIVAKVISFEFAELFNVDRPDPNSEIDRAVFTRKAVRSSGPARVGARRPAP